MSTSPHATAIRRDAEALAERFPALLIEAERIAQTVIAGLHGRRRAGPGETFWQHRAYSFGDAVASIDWRQSARSANRLYVRENEWEAAATVFIWRDPSASLDFASSPTIPDKRHRAEVLAVALAILLSQAGERVGLLGQARTPFFGRAAPSRLLEALLTSEGDAATPPPAEIRPGARVVLFSDFFTDPEPLSERVAAFASAGASGALVQVCDPAEEDFPYSGPVEFEDVVSADRLTFGDAGALTSAYQSEFARHRDMLTTLAQSVGWTFLSHRADHPGQHALLALYAALADARDGAS
ncbi:MAG: DUF58 domain-containing protein [Pseudomonadota bacterium]